MKSVSYVDVACELFRVCVYQLFLAAPKRPLQQGKWRRISCSMQSSILYKATGMYVFLS